MSVRVDSVAYGDSAGDWDDFVTANRSSSIYHHYIWRSLYHDVFHKETFYFVARRGGAVTGVLPLVRQRSLFFGDYLVSLPFVNYAGVLAADAESELALVEAGCALAEKIGVSHAEYRGYSPLPKLVSRQHKVAMRLALPETTDKLSKSLGAKVRSQIKRPIRENAKVQFGGSNLIDEFYEVFSINMRDLGTPVYGKDIFYWILSTFPDRAEIALVTVEDKTAAASILLHDTRSTEVPWASSNRAYNRIGVNMLLYWSMLERSIERGAAEFDFGRSTVDAGTYRFKKQWGAKPVELNWSYWLANGEALPDLSPENKKYAFAIRAWQKLPVPVTTLIGPLLARSLP